MTTTVATSTKHAPLGQFLVTKHNQSPKAGDLEGQLVCQDKISPEQEPKSMPLDKRTKPFHSTIVNIVEFNMLHVFFYPVE